MLSEKEIEGLSILIPVYNEVGNINNSLEKLLDVMKNFKNNFEVLIINDGSTDGTEAVIKNYLSEIDISHSHFLKNINIISHDENRGYGAALKTGIKESKYNYFAITDADQTYPDEKIPTFYEQIISQKADMIVGARVGKNVNIPLIRKPAKWMINKLANYLSGVKIPDLNSGLRVMKKNTVEKYMKILPDGFSFTTTITLAMLTNNYKVKYEKIDYFVRSGSSKIRPIYDTFNFIQLIIRTILLFRPLKVFLPISFLLIIIGILLLLYRIFVDAEFGVTATIIIVGGLQLLAIGMLADLIDRRLD